MRSLAGLVTEISVSATKILITWMLNLSFGVRSFISHLVQAKLIFYRF